MAAHNRLRNRRHSYRICPQKPCHADLCRCFIVRAGKHHVYALFQMDSVFLSFFLQTCYESCVIYAAHIRKTRAILLKIRTDQRIGAGIIDMVFNNHQCSWLIGAIYAPGSIGKKNLFNAQTLHNTDWKGDQSLTVSLIIVDSSLHGDHLFPHTGSQYKLARMARHSGYRKIRNIMIGNLYRVFDLIRIISQTASQNHTDLRLKICPFADDPDRILNDLYLFFSCHG